MEDAKWYKVLVNGKSCHGGTMEWSLPTDQPGEWMAVEGELKICSNGLHVTSKPVNWFSKEATVYLAECEEFGGTKGDKACFRRVRLVRELTNDELRTHQIAGDGEMSVNDGLAFAFGGCTVEASGSATVEASGSATVRAYGSATVSASDSATVRACDSATVRAYDSATVSAYDSATVRACDSATVNVFNVKCNITPDGYAVIIDRTQSPPVIRTGWMKEVTA